MQMLQNVRTHLQTEPGVKSEWLNGLESVLIQIIENERRVQPRITQYFKQGQSSQSTPTVTCNNNDNNNSNHSNDSEIHFI